MVFNINTLIKTCCLYVLSEFYMCNKMSYYSPILRQGSYYESPSLIDSSKILTKSQYSLIHITCDSLSTISRFSFPNGKTGVYAFISFVLCAVAEQVAGDVNKTVYWVQFRISKKKSILYWNIFRFWKLKNFKKWILKNQKIFRFGFNDFRI